MNVRLFIAVSAFAVVAGCQSRSSALTAMCQAPVDCAECMQADPSSRMRLLAQHIESSISNGEVESLFESMANMSADERTTAMEQMLQEEGISECPMLEIWAPDDEDAVE